VLAAIDERDAAERRAGQRLPTMIEREQLSRRQAVAWLGDTITIRSASRLLQLAQPDKKRVARVTGRRVDRTGLAALDRALANPTVFDRYRSKIVNAPDGNWPRWTGDRMPLCRQSLAITCRA
jgi:hypothetical protein